MLAPEAIEDLHELRANVRVAVRDAIEYRLEHDPRFLRRIQQARASLRAGKGVRLEDVKV